MPHNERNKRFAKKTKESYDGNIVAFYLYGKYQSHREWEKGIRKERVLCEEKLWHIISCKDSNQIHHLRNITQSFLVYSRLNISFEYYKYFIFTTLYIESQHNNQCFTKHNDSHIPSNLYNLNYHWSFHNHAWLYDIRGNILFWKKYGCFWKDSAW